MLNDNNNGARAGGNAPKPHLHRVSVEPPPFWKSEPQVWFIQLEAKFTRANITANIKKYNHIISAVNTKTLA